MGYSLPSYLSYCRAAAGTILLDLRRDWYFQLDPALEPTFSALARGDEQAADARHLRSLLELGVLEVRENRPTRLEPATVSAPIRSWRDEAGAGRASPLFIAEVWLAVRRARRQVSAVPFEHVIDRLRRRKAACANPTVDNREALTTLASRYAGARRSTPIDAVCLQDSLALLDVYARRGLFPSFVIGVTTAPFAAHCWLQTGELILNEALDEAAQFLPILVV